MHRTPSIHADAGFARITTQSISNRASIDALTSLRGIAAMLIFVHHMGLLMLPLANTAVASPLQKKCLRAAGSWLFIEIAWYSPGCPPLPELERSNIECNRPALRHAGPNATQRVDLRNT